MALVKKLQVGGQIDNDLNNELNTQLESFNLKGKDERKVRDALVKFRDYFKDSNGKSFSVDPLSQKYTVSGVGSEPFTGSPDEIHRGWFTGNLKIQNEQDAMSVAAAIYNKAKGNLSTKTVTNPNAVNSTDTREAINIGDLGEFVISDIYGTKDNFKTGFGTIKKDEDRKSKIFEFAQQNIANYLKAAELGKDKFDYADTEKIKDIQAAINNKDWDAFQNAAYKVKWEPQKFLLTDEQKAELALEAKTKADADAEANRIALGTAKTTTPKKAMKYIITTTHIPKKSIVPVQTSVGSGKIGELGNEASRIFSGEGTKTDWADALDAVALGGDVVSLGGTAAGLAGGLTSTAATLGSDILRGNGFWETAGNVGMNLGFTALSLIPGAASAKLGLKGVKAAAEVAKVAKDVDRVADVAKVVKYGIPELKNSVKWVADATKSVVKPNLANTKKLIGLTKVGLIGTGLYSGITSGIQAGKDINEGGLGNVSMQDVRGVFHGLNAANALRHTAQLHAGTKNVQVEDAFTNVKLKNPPKGVEAELKVPKGTDAETAINKHFDEVIKPKSDELAKLEANKTPENEKVIAELKEELKILNEGKANAKLDKGFLGIRGKVESITHLNDSKAKFERVIRDKPDERQWYPKKFQERAIAKLNKNNTVKSAEADKEKFDIKNIKVIKKGKSKSIDQKSKVDEYLKQRALRPKPIKPTKFVNGQGVIPFDKKGGILKAQNGLQLGNLNPKILSNKAKNKSNLNWNNANINSGIWNDDGSYSTDYTNKVNAITPEWFKANQAELQKRISESGSNYQLSTIDQLKRGATDSGKGVYWKNKKPGILHDLVLNTKTLETPITKVDVPTQVAQVSQVDDQNYDVDPSGNNWGIEQTPTTTVNNTQAKIPTTVNATGNLVNEGNKVNKFDWKKINKYLPDATDVSNLLMYANTISTNRRVGDEQRKSISDSMYTLPYRSNQYIRIDSPYSLQGEKQAATIENKSLGIANSISDIDKSMAARFTGTAQASMIRDKANVMDQQRVDQLRGIQLKMNDEVSKDNTKTLGQNRGLASQAFSKIHLINANQDLSNSTALNNLIIANARNIPAKQYKQGQTALYNAYTNPEYTNASEDYAKLNTDEGQASYKNSYNTDVKNLKYNKSWEESSHYKSWQDAITKAKTRVDVLYKPIQNLMIAQNFQQQLLKTGGSLSKQDKIDIARDKSESTKEMKMLEISFKSIIHNNEMLQKSLIRVFK